ATRDLRLVPPELRHIRTSLSVEDEMRRPLGVGPLREVFAVGAEDLDAVALAITDEHAAVGGHRDPARQVEMVGARSRRAPGSPQRAGRGELVPASVAVTTRDVDVAGRTARHVGRT